MTQFLPLIPAMFAALEPAPGFETDFSLAQRYALCAEPNVTEGMFDGAELLAVGGVVQNWRGRGMAWLLPGRRMTAAHWRAAIRRCRARLRELQAGGYWRIEATALASAPRRVAFLERLGFEREGLLRGYGPDGADHQLYARVVRPGERRSRAGMMGENI